ncbi:hypothetical protein RHMOL_Rhmol07G0153000 [Rhododendron molle]|uniref:Uncharacterized protein n=1 Tax=Rhododendron molle TaxID=49168 RepID=A0ACC0N132_RHOML|nr:hypothetical protein RHMOL_Rhmol07G0153000 [Rhododendron molle]
MTEGRKTSECIRNHEDEGFSSANRFGSNICPTIPPSCPVHLESLPPLPTRPVSGVFSGNKNGSASIPRISLHCEASRHMDSTPARSMKRVSSEPDTILSETTGSGGNADRSEVDAYYNEMLSRTPVILLFSQTTAGFCTRPKHRKHPAVLPATTQKLDLEEAHRKQPATTELPKTTSPTAPNTKKPPPPPTLHQIAGSPAAAQIQAPNPAAAPLELQTQPPPNPPATPYQPSPPLPDPPKITAVATTGSTNAQKRNNTSKPCELGKPNQ